MLGKRHIPTHLALVQSYENLIIVPILHKVGWFRNMLPQIIPTSPCRTSRGSQYSWPILTIQCYLLRRKRNCKPCLQIWFLFVCLFFHLWAYTVKKKKKLKRRKIHVSNKILVDLNNEHSVCCSITINKEDLYGLMHYYIWNGRANFKYWLLTRMKDLLCFLTGHTFGEKVRVIWHHRGSAFESLQEKWGRMREREKMTSRNSRRRGSGFSRVLLWEPVRKWGFNM